MYEYNLEQDQASAHFLISLQVHHTSLVLKLQIAVFAKLFHQLSFALQFIHCSHTQQHGSTETLQVTSHSNL